MSNSIGLAEDYFIRSGYQARGASTTLVHGSIDEYWTAARIRTASQFQYYVYQLCRDLIVRDKRTSVLDVGCGYPIKAKELLGPVCADITLVDQPHSAELVQAYFPAATFVPVDLETSAREFDRAFDLIVCADVVEHLANPTPCFAMIRKHLGSNGLAVVSTPEREVQLGASANRPGNQAHVREWNSAEFNAYLRSLGFDIVSHGLMPQKRLSPRRRLLGRLLASIGVRRDWNCGCQYAIVKRSEA